MSLSCLLVSLRSVSYLFLIISQLVNCGFSDSQSYENEILDEFRDSAMEYVNKDFMRSDGYLRRWLNVYNYDVQETMEKFKNTNKWRKEHNMDHILEEDFSKIDESYPISVDGVDKDGRPLLWIPFGSFDLRKMTISGHVDLYHRYSTRAMELVEVYLHNLAQLSGRDNITQVVVILDFSGYNVKTGGCYQCLQLIPELMSNMEHNYPNLFHMVYIINAPTMFQTFFKIARNFMSAQTKAATHLFGYNKEVWSAALLQQISAEQLPSQYGGLRSYDIRTTPDTRVEALARSFSNAHQNFQAVSLRRHTKDSENFVNSVQEDSKDESVQVKVVDIPSPNSDLDLRHHHHHHHYQPTVENESSAQVVIPQEQKQKLVSTSVNANSAMSISASANCNRGLHNMHLCNVILLLISLKTCTRLM